MRILKVFSSYLHANFGPFFRAYYPHSSDNILFFLIPLLHNSMNDAMTISKNENAATYDIYIFNVHDNSREIGHRVPASSLVVNHIILRS